MSVRWTRRRSNFRSMLPVAEKNYVLSNGAGVAAGTVSQIIIALADGLGNDNSVEFPCRVKAIYITGSIRSQTYLGGGTTGFMLYKDTGNANPAMNPNSVISNIGQQITFLWRRMSSTTGLPGITFDGWVRIPKRFQIFNEGDALRCSLSATADVYDFCMNFVYKWRA